MSSSESSREGEDLISNVPSNVADEILTRLPILMAARTSVLSKQWRRNWLSLSRLWFSHDFWGAQKNEDGSVNWQKGSHFISTILFLHNSPITSFVFDIPEDFSYTIQPWLCFLAKNEVKVMGIVSRSTRRPMASQIFSCNDLQYLLLHNFTLSPPPTDFKGFPKLYILVLRSIKFSQPDLFCSLIANCPQLTSLQLENWTGMDHVVIDIPTLQSLTLNGLFKSLVFRNVSSLESISVCLISLKISTTIVTTKDVCLLASSSKLQCIEFNGLFCKCLAAGGITSSHRVAFNHLTKLCLSDLYLGDFTVFRYVIGMIKSCLRIQELEISVVKCRILDQHKLDLSTDHKLSQLLKIKITGVTGSCAELKLIEYLLAVSEVLEEMLLHSKKLATSAELTVLRALTEFRRASPMARVRLI